MTPKLSIIIVNFRSSQELEHCLRSLHVATQASLEVIVVDNSPEDGAKEILHSSGFHGHYFPQSQNIGFTKAVNFGTQHAIGETLCIVHPDVLFEGHSLDRLIAWVDQHPRTVVGPRQRDPQGDILTTAYPHTSKRTIWGPAEHQGSPWPRSWHPALSWISPQLMYSLDTRVAAEPQLVPVLNSSCLVASRSVWEEIGGLNEALQFVGLESEWFKRAEELGVTAWYIPEAIVFHEQAASVGKIDGWKVREITNRDRWWYARRFGIVAIVGLAIVLWFERILRPHDAA